MTDLAWMRENLAELCGLPVDTAGRFTFENGWRPDEDVEQAIRCVEALGLRMKIVHGRRAGVWHVEAEDGREYWDDKGDLCRSVCLAIASAMGWEPPKAGGGNRPAGTDGDGREGE